MLVRVDGSPLTQDWKTGLVSAGIKPTIKVAHAPKTIWNGNPIAPSGAVLYLPGLPGAGATIKDYSGQGNDGAITGGATWGAFASGLPRLSYDGTDGLVTLGSNASLRPTTALSVGLWINFAEFKAVQFPMAYGSTGFFGWMFYCDANGDLQFYIGNGTARENAVYRIPAVDVWHHVVGTYDNVDVRIYVDAALKNTDDIAGPVSYTGLTAGYIGNAEGLNAARYFKGIAALTFLTASTLTLPQITQDYNQTRHLFGV